MPEMTGWEERVISVSVYGVPTITARLIICFLTKSRGSIFFSYITLMVASLRKISSGQGR